MQFDMSGFKPLNLAQLYQSADAAVGQAMQTNLLMMQAGRMKQEYAEEDQLRTLAKDSTVTGPDGQPTFDLKGFTRGAYSVNPMKALGFEKSAREAEKAGMEKEKLQGEIDEKRMKSAGDRLKAVNEATTVPFLKYKELTEKGMPDAEARRQVQPMYQTAVQSLVTSGLFTEQQLGKFNIKPEFDPTDAEAGMRHVLGAKDQLAQYWNEKNYGQKDKHHKDSMEMQLAGQRITVRGQNLTDARSRDQLNQSLTLGRLEIDKDRGVVFDKITKQTWPMTMGTPMDGGGAGEFGGQGGKLPPKASDVEGLRKEFNQREEVKNYNAAVPILRSIAGAKQNAAGDLDFIYGVGKILDPNSVVREGEMNLVISTGSPLERALGTTSWAAGDGKLTPALRQKLMGMLHSRVAELRTAAEDARKPFEAQANRQGIPISETITLPELPKLPDRRGAKGKPDATLGGGAAVGVKAPDGVTYYFKDQAAASAFKAKAGIE